MKYFWMSSLMTLVLINPSAHAHKAHVHGLAKLTLALDDDTHATLDLDVAADSIMGFEHEAKSAADKKTKDDSLQKLREHTTQVIHFDSAAGCEVKATKVEMEKEAAGLAKDALAHGEHADVNASYTVSCIKPLPGSKIQVSLIGLFPRIHAVNLQILGSSGQSATEVKDEHQSITLP